MRVETRALCEVHVLEARELPRVDGSGPPGDARAADGAVAACGGEDLADDGGGAAAVEEEEADVIDAIGLAAPRASVALMLVGVTPDALWCAAGGGEHRHAVHSGLGTAAVGARSSTAAYHTATRRPHWRAPFEISLPLTAARDEGRDALLLSVAHEPRRDSAADAPPPPVEMYPSGKQ